MTDLITRLNQRVHSDQLNTDSEFSNNYYEPLCEKEVMDVEQRLGFRLTPLLHRIYTEVANGGIGPSYGLLGLRGGMLNEDGHDVEREYLFNRQSEPNETEWFWPERLLPIGHLGCAMYMCVDCSKDAGPITWFEPNIHDVSVGWEPCFIPAIDSTEKWLSDWLVGEDFFKRDFKQVYQAHIDKFDWPAGLYDRDEG